MATQGVVIAVGAAAAAFFLLSSQSKEGDNPVPQTPSGPVGGSSYGDVGYRNPALTQPPQTVDPYGSGGTDDVTQKDPVLVNTAEGTIKDWTAHLAALKGSPGTCLLNGKPATLHDFPTANHEWSHAGPGQCFDFHSAYFRAEDGGYDPNRVTTWMDGSTSMGVVSYKYHDGTTVTPVTGSVMEGGGRYDSAGNPILTLTHEPVEWDVEMQAAVTPEQVANWTYHAEWQGQKACSTRCRDGYTPGTIMNTPVPAPYLQTRDQCKQFIPQHHCRKDGIWNMGTPVDVYWGDELVNVVNI